MAARIHLKTGQFRKFASLRWPRLSDRKRAEEMGINHGTLIRVMAGTTAPGEKFIAATLASFPELDFTDLFEVLSNDDEQAS